MFSNVCDFMSVQIVSKNLTFRIFIPVAIMKRDDNICMERSLRVATTFFDVATMCLIVSMPRARHESRYRRTILSIEYRRFAAVARYFIANDRLGTRNAVITRLNAPRGAFLLSDSIRFVEAGAKRKVYLSIRGKRGFFSPNSFQFEFDRTNE